MLFSFQKILVLIGIVGAVWYAFRMVGRWQKERERQGEFDKRKDQRRAEQRAAEQAAAKSDPKGGKWRAPWSKKAAVEAEEMVECKVCGAYVPSSKPSNCGRGDCPY
jgi:FtsZ-interacting cell division protein ZipA